MQNKEFLPAPQSIPEAMEMAELLANSGFVPKAFEKNPNAVLVAMMWAHSFGMTTPQAMQSLAVINGKPCLYGDGALAVVNGSGLLEDITEEIVERDGTKVAICMVKRVNRTKTVRTFSLKDAERAGLLSRNPVWKSYPQRMLQMRARAWALRDAFPDVLSGIGISEEQQDVIPEDEMTGTADHGANTEPKTASKGPRRKSKTIDTSTASDIEEATPTVSLEAVPEVAQADVVPQDEPPLALGAEAPSEDEVRWKSIVDSATSITALTSVWKSLPTALKGSQEVIDYFTSRKKALQAEVA